jgi:DNA-binding NtrC family response regulator
MKETSKPNLPLSGARVLVVEDDVILLLDIETILSEAGAEVVGRCRTITEALAAVQNHRFCAAVMDVRVGRETIVPVARELQKRGTPFLFYTGQVGVENALEEWPKSNIITKPAKAQTVVEAVAKLLA